MFRMHSGGEHVTFTDMAINFVSGSLGELGSFFFPLLFFFSSPLFDFPVVRFVVI
jgi:hypothetical protein